jgi:pyruvate dehydrogenase E2 component (dihydrolipoamide acetyltransferase)
VAGTGTPSPTSSLITSFATMFGIDLLKIPGTGRGGRITNADVRQYIQFLQAKAFEVPAVATSSGVAVAGPQPLGIDFSKWGEVDSETLSGLRQKISENMVKSWTTVPHVTQFDDADITHVMALRKKYNDAYKAKNARITVTVFAVKAIVSALQAFPNFNASFDSATGEFIRKKYYNIGIAVDTPSGLIVPVIKHADQKSLLEISQELEVIAQKARDRKLGMDDLRGGTFTISNLGSLGVSSFTPIVNHPEVAILGLSKGTLTPVYTDKGVLEAKMLMPVSLSYDHRVIDGADGARFTRHFIDAIQSFEEKWIKI